PSPRHPLRGRPRKGAAPPPDLPTERNPVKISTRTTCDSYFNYETRRWDGESWEYYDVETGEPVPAWMAERLPEDIAPEDKEDDNE
ncbi:hypothetical protein ACFQ07_21735, partial [Actinomadura adrarensis]